MDLSRVRIGREIRCHDYSCKQKNLAVEKGGNQECTFAGGAHLKDLDPWTIAEFEMLTARAS
jgi:hypothetical protein